MGITDPNGIYRMEVEDRVSKKYVDEIARLKAELAQMRARNDRLELATAYLREAVDTHFLEISFAVRCRKALYELDGDQ